MKFISCFFLVHPQARQAELKSLLEQRAAGAVSSPQQQQQEMVAAHEMLAKQQVSQCTRVARSTKSRYPDQGKSFAKLGIKRV